MSISRSVAFVTYDLAPALTADDRLAAAALEARGVAVDPVVWSDPGVDWRRYECVVLRSTWDYHRRVAEFRAWLDTLDESRVPVWNPVPLARWNLDKRYLRELATRGVPTVPTIWLERGSEPVIAELLATHGWTDAVVKPVVGATAYRTVRIALDQPAAERSRLQEIVHAALALDDAMLQPFLPEVHAEGEWSLVFFGGEFSHAVLKQPAAGDFRVQSEFGGTAVDTAAPAEVLAGARAVLDRVAEPWLYARVDGVRSAHAGFLLMELEMLEPSLFLSLDRAAPARFAEAILGPLAW